MVTYRPNGTKIKSLRRAKKLSQEAVAALSENLPRPYGSVSDRTLRTAERGTSRVSEEQLKAIAAVLEVSLDVIIIPDREVEPFRGLQCYGLEDRTLFGGRDTFSARGVAMLKTHGVALIAGPSGSGKSSLCYAGIVPQILDFYENSVLVSFRPGITALDALTSALCAAFYKSENPTKTAEALSELRSQLEKSDQGLADIISAARIQNSASTVLIYIDQGEELSTRANDAEVVLRLLGEALKREAPHLKLLISARSDYLGELTHLSGDFFSRFDRATLVLRRMNDEELREALVRPLQETSVPYEELLIDALIDDARNQEGYLPHIQFVLSSLWHSDLPQKSRLTVERYFEEGRLSRAIARHASEVYERLSSDEQERLKAALPRLVAASMPGRDVEARKPLDTFTPITQNLLSKLADPDTRILTIDEDGIVSFAHEEIIRQWPELRSWLDEYSEDLRLRDGLERDIEAWLYHDESEGYLIPYGEKLKSYELLLRRLSEDSCPAKAKEFVGRSKEKYSIMNRMTPSLIAATVLASLMVLAVVVIYSFRQDPWLEVKQLSKNKDQSFMRSRKLFFPDWPLKRFALYKEISQKFDVYYPSGEKRKFIKALQACISLTDKSLDYIEVGGTSLEEYVSKCGYGGISGLESRFALLTQMKIPKDFYMINGKLFASFLNRINFRNADLENTYMPCSMIDGSDFSKAKNFVPAQIEESFCLFIKRGPPTLPKGWALPKGCQWMQELKSKYGWKTYNQAPKDSFEVRKYQKQVIEKHYYQCIRKEDGYRVAETAFKLAMEGKLSRASVEARRAMQFNNDVYVKLKTAPVLILTGYVQLGKNNYNAIKGKEHPRWDGRLEKTAIRDITALGSAGYTNELLKSIKSSLIKSLGQ